MENSHLDVFDYVNWKQLHKISGDKNESISEKVVRIALSKLKFLNSKDTTLINWQEEKRESKNLIL